MVCTEALVVFKFFWHIHNLRIKKEENLELLVLLAASLLMGFALAFGKGLVVDHKKPFGQCLGGDQYSQFYCPFPSGGDDPLGDRQRGQVGKRTPKPYKKRRGFSPSLRLLF